MLRTSGKCQAAIHPRSGGKGGLAEETGQWLCGRWGSAVWGEGVQKGGLADELTNELTQELSYERCTRVLREFTRDYGQKNLRCMTANGRLAAAADRDGCGVCGGYGAGSSSPIGTTWRKGFGPVPTAATAIRGFTGSACNNMIFIRQIAIGKSRRRTWERRQRGQATGGLPAFSRRARAGTRPVTRPECQT